MKCNMQFNIKTQTLFTSLLLAGSLFSAHAQGTAFTYQGRLNDGPQLANGSYDLKFSLLDMPAGGGAVAEPVTNVAVAVSSGLFTVTLDFGQSPFTGAERWLELAVRTNGPGPFTTLAPRQKLTATPYALLAAETTSTNVARLDVPNTATPATAVPVIANGFVVGANIISGGSGYITPPAVTVNDAAGSGATMTAAIAGGKVMALSVNNAGSGYSAGATLTIDPPPSNAYQVFPGMNHFNNSANTFAGTFTGNGAGLTGLNASQLTSGIVPDGRLVGTYSGAVSFINPSNTFAGTFTGSGADLTSLNASQLATGTVPDERLGLNLARTNQVWLLGGNAGTTPGIQFLGTSDNQPLELMVNGHRALRLEPNNSTAPNVIGGSAANSVAPGVVGATIGGGGLVGWYSNRVESSYATISGGAANSIQVNSVSTVIGGGYLNTIQTNATCATVSGGYLNTIEPHADYATIGGGSGNTNGYGADYASIAGGRLNRILYDADYASIGGGYGNSIQTNAQFATIAGGGPNIIGTNASYSAIGGGGVNTIEPHANGATIAGGTRNTNGFGADYATLGGGRLNRTEYDADYASIGGGNSNLIQTNADYATIAGGGANLIEPNATSGTIAGGSDNTIQSGAVDGSIGGGWYNTIETNAIRSTISGGSFNLIASNATYSAIGGGGVNTIEPHANGAIIAGGTRNTNGFGADNSTIGGGRLNRIENDADYASIGGGQANTVQTNADHASIGGGYGNTVETNAFHATIGGGGSNLIQSNALDATIGGGLFNSIGVNCYSATLGGGQRNSITGAFGTIPGGVWNSATNYAFAAGYLAKASHPGAFVWADSTPAEFGSTAPNQFNVRAMGGVRLITGGAGATLDGQPLLTAAGTGSQLTGLNASQLASGTVPSGRLSGTYSASLSFNNPGNTFVGTFSGNSAGLTQLNASQLTSGTVPDGRLSANVALLNTAQQFSGAKSFSAAPSFTAAGAPFTVSSTTKVTSLNADLLDGLDSSDFASASHDHDATYAKQGGNGFGATMLLGTSDNQPFELKADNQRALRLEPNASGAPNILGGASNNVAGAGVVGGTIGGGGAIDYGGRAYTNAVLANFGTIGGGGNNMIQPDAALATIGGGYGNTIQTKANSATIGGGSENIIQVSGEYAAIPGGYQNSATNFAFAAGNQAKADHTGAFVWGDSTAADIASTNANSVTMRASGGYRLFSNNGASAGVSLAPGSGSWTSMSDRNAKESLAPVDTQAVLAKVAALPLATWNYKAQDESIRHLGPMAQDFKAAFGLGETDTGITSVDADGVALAAIQGLNQKLENKLQQKETEISELKQSVAALQELVSKLAGQWNGGGR